MWEGLCSSSTHPTCYTPLGGSCLYASYHWAMRPLHSLKFKINSLNLVELYLMMNSKVHLRQNSGKDFQPLCLGHSNLLFLCSSVSCCRRCLRWAKRCSFCSANSCWRLLLRCSHWISSRCSRSREISVENVTRRGTAATCCAAVVCHLYGKLLVIHRS